MSPTKATSKPPVAIRRMAPHELEQVTEAWYRSLVGSLAFLRPEQLRSEEEYKGFFRGVVVTTRDLWVAEWNGQIVGVLALEDNELDRLYVVPEAQRQQIGAALLEHAKALHPEGLTLVTHQRNAGARRFYERHGFAALKFGTSPPPESEPDVVYGWSGTPGRRMDCQTVVPPYEPSFIEELYLFASDLFGQLDREEVVWRLTHMPNSSVHVAREGQIVGFKMGYAVGRQRYHSWLGGVRSDRRRQGIASRLMDGQHEWLRAQGYTSVETSAVPANAAMLMLNLRAGFRVIGSYSRGDYLRVTLAKDLSR